MTALNMHTRRCRKVLDRLCTAFQPMHYNAYTIHNTANKTHTDVFAVFLSISLVDCGDVVSLSALLSIHDSPHTFMTGSLDSLILDLKMYI